MKTVRRNYFILLILGFVFAAPGISAYFFYNHPHWLAGGSTNKGVFLNPPVLMPQFNDETNRLHEYSSQELQRAKHRITGRPDNRPSLAGPKWQLVLWSPTACEKSCLEQLDKLARIRLALGRRLYEVAPSLLLDAKAPPLAEPWVAALKEQDIQILKLPMRAREQMPVLKNRFEIFIVNPENYIVLAYRTSVNPADIFHDIKQLLTTTEKMGK